MMRAWTDRSAPPAFPGASKKAKAKPDSTGPRFLFGYAGKVVAEDQTPDGLGLVEGDTIWAIEVVDMSSSDGLDDRQEVCCPLFFFFLEGGGWIGVLMCLYVWMRLGGRVESVE